ncbi:MAG TPA: ATP-dependent sacrificial sulfur transferase LarE [Humisphaera sp.]|jgi:uncharacterized protein|nr:ATP-dependent sacrificial sulfur transferase LarE [Humisphaera sp.]
MASIDDKLNSLRAIIRGFSSALIAYSGGVDSALVLAVAHEQLADRALACIGCSPSYPQRELAAAVALAESLGANYRLIHPQEHLNPQYAANPNNRCYFCKSQLFQLLHNIATTEGWEVIADGVNVSDIEDHRFGISAAREVGVRSPLLEAGLTKEDVRQLALQLGLSVWDKPASPCLSSRVPHGTAITPRILQMIEQAEDAILALGFRDVRVRHHGDVALIELPLEDLQHGLELRDQILASVRAAGYRFVALDLAGLRSGSLNFTPLTVHSSIR